MPCRVWLTTVGALIALLASLPAEAESSCRTRCWAAYGTCYKSTSKRQRCQSLLYQCLSNCLRTYKR